MRLSLDGWISCFSTSTFVWSVTTNGLNAVTAISYTNWDWRQPNDIGEVCVLLWRVSNYRWADQPCTAPLCAVCEVDLRRHRSAGGGMVSHCNYTVRHRCVGPVANNSNQHHEKNYYYCRLKCILHNFLITL